MKKKPEDINYFCITSIINRKSVNKEKWRYTGYFDGLDENRKAIIAHTLELQEGELAIAYTWFSDDRWNLLATRRFIEQNNGKVSDIYGADIIEWDWGDFKGFLGDVNTQIQLTTKSGKIEKFEIETGSASMVMIYGIRYIIGGHEEI